MYYIYLVRFVWDPRKAASNLRKYGVAFEEASSAFEDKLGAYYPDSLHAERFILIGYSRRQRLLYVVHAEVELEAIRIISARKATRHEKTRYEKD
ncbi:MAG: BrnT family toxin [Candidatus Binatia bacterium]